MRTFEFTGGGSNKFWNIAREGGLLNFQWGRLGTAGQSQIKDLGTEAAAIKEHDKLVKEKLGKGYRETTAEAAPAPGGGSMREALEAALVESPDELANHMAYADWLGEEGDPRGEFIRIQLALEDESKDAAERKRLKSQETKLLKKHRAEWLGELGGVIIDPKPHPEYEWRTLEASFTFRRGWLDSLKLGNYGVEDMRVLARSPATRLLRTLHLYANNFEEEGEFEPGDDIPPGEEYAVQLFPLLRSRHLGNVRTFILGEQMSDKDDRDADDGEFNCNTEGAGAVGLIKKMPRLEELHLLAHGITADELFTLKTLSNLRVLLLYHNNSYPVARLAKNPTFRKLEVLRLHPHAMDDEHPYIRLPAVKALVHSPELVSLRHLQIRLTDAGDKGVKEVVESGILERLEVLDLRHGCITDKGARLLAACPSLPKLKRLELGHNNMTAEGVEAVRATGVNVDAESQWRKGEIDDFDSEYLYAGDIE
jgi:uncharacterized protein (TIGR02996 family)